MANMLILGLPKRGFDWLRRRFLGQEPKHNHPWPREGYVPDGMEHRRLEGEGAGYIICHGLAACKGRPCPIHFPSDHHMRSWRQLWRDDRGIMERICPHGIGHPDPDCRSAAKDGVHGCDGCCAPPWAKRAFQRMVTG